MSSFPAPTFAEFCGGMLVSVKRPLEDVKVDQSNKKRTTKQLVERLDMTLDSVNYHIRELKKAGVLRRIGGRKLGHWEILK